MSEEQEWVVTVTFTTEDRQTRADAALAGGPDELIGVGRAKRNPDDPEVPAIGHEIAAARALADLSHHLVEEAAHRIESWQGRPATVAE
jgi:hypothetical protein